MFALVAAPRVNAGAWFALAVAGPLALLALGAAASQAGLPRAAGFWAATLLLPAIVLAIRSLETRWAQAVDGREAELRRAFALTTGQASGLLLVVAAGARFSGEAIALALAMAAAPLALAVAADLWRRVIPPLGLAEPAEEPLPRRNWTLEWAQASGAPQATVMRLLPRAGRVTLRVSPAPVDEAWMVGGEDRRAA